MSEISDKSLDGQTLAEESGTALQNITSSIEAVNLAISHIASAANQQSTGAEEILTNLQGVSSVVKEMAGSLLNLSETTGLLNQEVNQLNRLMGQFQI